MAMYADDWNGAAYELFTETNGPVYSDLLPLYFQVVAKIFMIFVRTNKRIGLSIEKSISELRYVF